MWRRISERLNQWKRSPTRKPLLLFGARQVGKTYALREFGSHNYEGVAYVDFARDPDAAPIFDGSLEPKHVVALLQAYLGMDILPGKTLIVLDEAQLCERALTSLKYFCDEAPEYHIAVAGSLLGVKFRRERSLFPVGKVDMLDLHPMDIEEFFAARGERRLMDEVAKAFERNAHFALHERAMELYREYLLVGGMPEPVATYIASTEAGARSPLEAARTKQAEISLAYLADIAKYAPSSDMPRIAQAWESVPAQLAKENHKFQYKAIRSGARAQQYESALDWLLATGTVSKCTRVTEGIAPLAAFADPASFKLYQADTGLLAASFHATGSDVQPSDSKASRFRGSLAENYVMQQLVARDVTPYYWGVPSRAEVEFVTRDVAGNVIPIEVKSGTNVRSSSLATYARTYEPTYSVRISARNFGFEGGIRSVPLYAAGCLAKELESEGASGGLRP